MLDNEGVEFFVGVRIFVFFVAFERVRGFGRLFFSFLNKVFYCGEFVYFIFLDIGSFWVRCFVFSFLDFNYFS